MKHRRSEPSFIGKYLRVTHEEMSRDLLGTIQHVYNFINRAVPKEVKSWATELTSLKPAKQKKMGLKTNKNPKDVMDKWRSELDVKYIRAVENECQHFMKEMGYEDFQP